MGIKVGLLLDDVQGSKYVLDLVNWSKSTADVEITHLIVHADKSPKVGRVAKWTNALLKDGCMGTADRLLAGLFTTAAFFVERRLLGRSERDKDHLESFDLEPMVPAKVEITPLIAKSGLECRFSDADIDQVKSLGLDVLIGCGSPPLLGGILTAAKFGVWSLHYADNRIYRGGPAGFWEVYYESDTTGFTIQRLTEEFDGGDVMMRGWVQTQYYQLLNQAALNRKSNYYMKVLLSRLAAGIAPSTLEPIPYSHRLFRTPDARRAGIYLARLLGRVAANNVLKIRGVDENRWSVGFIKGDWRNAVLWRGARIKNPPNHFLADPFVVSRNGDNFCFVEDYDYRQGKACISVYKLIGDRGSLLGEALIEPFHLSFPYIFEFGGNLYMCPESAEDRRIRVYKCMEFPLKWKLEKIIMNVVAVDSMLFERGGKWWLLTNTDSASSGDFYELSAFWADSPLSVDWRPHPQNPIYVDARCARNGGLLRDGSRLFRVCQSQGYNLYGKAARIREIVELSETVYREREVGELVAQFADDIRGTHHMHSSGQVTVFDMIGPSKITA